MLRIPFASLQDAFFSNLVRLGFKADRAQLAARLFAETDRDGVYTHGLARFGRFASMVRSGVVVPTAEPTLLSAAGALERWDGNSGPGNLNAYAAMERATQLASTHGLGAVALRHTNHWMRGGSYGWQAADDGCFAMCWTNTLPNLPAWETAESVLGNNPLVMAVPRPSGEHVVLDMAMSQYSYGTLAAYAARGEQLPYPGGFDAAGALTTDPAAIAQTNRALPIGLWKGSGLSLTLDLFAAMLSDGSTTHEISREPERETSLSQFFLAIDARRLVGETAAIADRVLANLHAAPTAAGTSAARYPGEGTLATRRHNMAEGVPIDETLWNALRAGTL